MKLILNRVARWLDIPGDYTGAVSGFRQDSRFVIPGDLFFALEGEKVDGHAYLKEVSVQGAVAAVVSSSYQGADFGLQLLKVNSVLGALQSLAKQVHQEYPCRVIGVTGSVGKTTTKEFIFDLLKGSFRLNKTPGNANSQVGVPLSLLNAQGDEEVFVVEMGMSQPHEIEQLIEIAPPEIALITAVALSHAAYFPDGLEGIARAKSEILSASHTRYGILSAQVASFSASRQGTCKKITYGREEEAVYFKLCSHKEGYYLQEGEEKSPLFKLPFSASHLCENFTAAACVARVMGVSWTEILLRARELKPFSKRFESVEHKGILFINDSYNANPTSMLAALRNLPYPVNGGKKIAALGGMKELGAYEVESHRLVANEAIKQVDHLLCLGKECAPMLEVFSENSKPAEFFIELTALKKRLFELAEPGDVVLLKGSNSNKLWQILDP